MRDAWQDREQLAALLQAALTLADELQMGTLASTHFQTWVSQEPMPKVESRESVSIGC